MSKWREKGFSSCRSVSIFLLFFTFSLAFVLIPPNFYASIHNCILSPFSGIFFWFCFTHIYFFFSDSFIPILRIFLFVLFFSFLRVLSAVVLFFFSERHLSSRCARRRKVLKEEMGFCWKCPT